MGQAAGAERWAARKRQMARVGAWLFGAAAAVTLLGVLLPHQPEVDDAGLWGVAAAAALAAAFLALAGERLDRALAVAPAYGTLLVSLALLFNGERHGGPAGGDEMYYLWVVLYTAHFLGRLATAVHVLLITAAYTVTLIVMQLGPIGVSRWLSTVGLVIGAAVVVRLLSERVDGLVSELHTAARTDPVTGLRNRRAFEEEFAREARRTERSGRPFALVIADLDRFKQVNDLHGHVAGDGALAAVGELLQAELRGSDFAARIGGDEFALLLPEADADTARFVASRVCRALHEHQPISGLPLNLSCGVAVFGEDGGTLDELIRAADRGLYAEKRQERNGSQAGQPVAQAG